MAREIGDLLLLGGQDAAHHRAAHRLAVGKHRLRLHERRGSDHARMLATALRTPRQSSSRLSSARICRCETTPRMRVRTSFWKPFITESTTISAHTPTAMPIMETAELMPMKRLRRRARV